MTTLTKYSTATAVTIALLGIFLGFLHVFLGITAFTPIISQDYHRDLNINYNAFAKSLTFLHSLVDKTTLAYYMRLIFPGLHIAFGAMLMENNYFGFFGNRIGNIGLLLLNIVSLSFHFRIGTPYERLASIIVFIILLGARQLIIEQSTKKTKIGVKTRNAGKPKSSTPKKNKSE